jgi:ABC-type glycerol-3-phosphate transport system permease component
MTGFPRRAHKNKARPVDWVLNALLAMILFWATFPYLWALICSFKPADALFTQTPSFLPIPFTLESYRWALTEPSFVLPMRNSILVSGLTALVTLVVSSLAAYSLARLQYPGKTLVIVVLMSSQMVPTMLLIITIFLLFAQLHLFNTLPGLVLASTAWTAPYAVLLLRSFLFGVAAELEEAALVDGCTRLKALWYITLPLSVAGLVAAGLFIFVWTWGDMIFPLILTKDIDHQTAALSLFTLLQSTRGATNYGGLLAAGVLFILPTVASFAILQRYLIQGTAAGSLRG